MLCSYLGRLYCSIDVEFNRVMAAPMLLYVQSGANIII